VEYRKLGRWGVRLSTVGLGSWLTYGGSVEDGTAADIDMDHAPLARVDEILAPLAHT
jgi:aryl-alcohol dehydrogenase-like predicted oxidoreductase